MKTFWLSKFKNKLECIENIKPNQATFFLKDLLSDSSAVDKNQSEILEKLRLAVSTGEDIIIDLQAYNRRKPLYEHFLGSKFPYLIFPSWFIITKQQSTVT